MGKPDPIAFPFTAEGLQLDPRYAELREERPAAEVRLPYGEDGLLVTRLRDVRTVLTDRRFSRSAAAENDHPRVVSERQTYGIVGMDPPEHTLLRSLVSPAFTQRQAERVRPTAEVLAAELADRMRGLGSADLVEDFAIPFTHAVISSILGIPPEDRQRFRAWTEQALSTAVTSRESSAVAGEQMWEYLDAQVQERTARPMEDLISTMVCANADVGATEAELVMLTMMVLVAGYETTASHIGNFTYLLLSRTDGWAALSAAPGRIPVAVEELLRWTPLETSPAPPRYALEDVELSGCPVRAGTPVLADIAAANRDPDAFVDPDRLDLDRAPNPHVAFGHGPHHCVGSQMARMMLQVSLTTLTRELPTMRVAVPEHELRWRTGALTRGLVGLPVIW